MYLFGQQQQFGHQLFGLDLRILEPRLLDRVERNASFVECIGDLEDFGDRPKAGERIDDRRVAFFEGLGELVKIGADKGLIFIVSGLFDGLDHGHQLFGGHGVRDKYFGHSGCG